MVEEQGKLLFQLVCLGCRYEKYVVVDLDMGLHFEVLGVFEVFGIVVGLGLDLPSVSGDDFMTELLRDS